jgi:single-stranded-DNA-specific exonuclease
MRLARLEADLIEPAAEPREDALSVLGQRWRMRAEEDASAARLARQLGIPDILHQILAGRGIAPHQARALAPTLREYLPDPLHLKDMEKAARRLARALGDAGEKIAVFGDYDVDGATSAALLLRYCRALGNTPLVHIPDRIKEGYGPNLPALLALQARGATLCVTVDCGTMSHQALGEAAKAGIDIIVADHHQSELRLPECHALVNPNRYDETSPHRQMAACGVVFLLLVATNKYLREAGRPVPDLLQWLDLVALGTICDVMTLDGVNRALVAQGLKLMRQRRNPGICAVLESARLTQAPDAYHAGFVIGPRINAGGRVGKADLGVRLLTTDDPLEAKALAAELELHNAERKAIEAQVLEEAMEEAARLPASDAVLVVAREGWHPGVIGIVAGRLKEHWRKPVAVVALDNGLGKASARSVDKIDLGAAIVSAVQEGILKGGGGHAMAAGFTVAAEAVQALRDFLNLRLSNQIAALPRERTLWIDGAVALGGLTIELARLIEQAGPFGAGNPQARLMLRGIRILHPMIVGTDHLRVILVDASASNARGLKAMAFRSVGTKLGETLLASGRNTLHVAGQLRIGYWQGQEKVEFFIDDAMRI